MPIYDVPYGFYETLRYELRNWAEGVQAMVGMDMEVRFTLRGLPVPAQVVLIQTVRCRRGEHLDANYYREGGAPEATYLTPGGWHVDAKGRSTPGFGLNLYGSDRVGPAELQWSKVRPDDFAGYVKGRPGRRGPPAEHALLHDKPQRAVPGQRFVHQFETVAVCVTGAAAGQHFGALTWGYEVDAAGHAQAAEPQAAESPSAEWREACRRWNLMGGHLFVPGVPEY